MLHGSNDADSQKGVPFLALVDIAALLGSQIAPNLNIASANTRFPAKGAKYYTGHIIKTTASIITRDHRVLSVGGPNMP